jgi:short-subunit dehydrogenase
MSFHSDREYRQAGTRGTAVVTGASAGLGRVFAERLARQRYNLILVARRASKLAELALELRKQYEVSVEPIAADLATSEGVDRIAEYFSVRDDITLLLNNAGTSILGNVSETSSPANRYSVPKRSTHRL